MICVNSVTICPSSLSLKVGETYTSAYALVCPSNASCPCIKWHSSKESVATVDSRGNITAKSVGSAVIYATAQDGSNAYGKCSINVSAVKVTSITVSPSSVKLSKSSSKQFTATISPKTATNCALSWCSSNPSVASVNASTGLVLANNVGNATIYANATDGSGCQGMAKVTVFAKVSSIDLSSKCLSLKGGESATLTAAVCPSNAENRSVSWSSSNERVATVKDGKVTAVSKGTAVIYATAKDGSGVRDCCTVTVSTDILVSSIKISPSAKNLEPGDTLLLQAAVSPINATNCTLRWTSSNPCVATVNPYSGLVQAIGKGTAYISAEAQDGSCVKGTCAIYVTVHVEKIEFEFKSQILLVGEQRDLSVKITPADASYQKPSFYSSDSDVVSVDNNGHIVAIKNGKVTIHAALDGCSAECTITVAEAFQYDSSSYNQKLAEKCALYSMLAYDGMIAKNGENEGDIEYVDEADKESNSGFPDCLEETLEKDGFYSIEDFNYDDDDEIEESMHNVSYTLAHKYVIKNGIVSKLMLVVIRGTSGVEWKGNMDVTGNYYNKNMEDHYSFKKAAEDLLTNTEKGLQKYLEEYDAANMMFLITGHSRGAAVANLVANDLTETYGKYDVFAYTFATPNNTRKPILRSNIFNFCFEDDFVPQVPLKDWGYSKHGVCYSAVAGDLYEINADFKAEMDRYIFASKEKKEVPFPQEKTKELLDYVSSKWRSIAEYYKMDISILDIVEMLLKLSLTGELDLPQHVTLYDFFRDYVAPAAMGENKKIIAFTFSEEYGKIARFFIFGSGADINIDKIDWTIYSFQDYIYNTHCAFAYYTAVKHGLFYHDFMES